MRDGWRVRVPASSANLGPAFDAVAVALDLHLEVSADGDEPAGENHPAVRAFRDGGGRGPLCVRARFPGGRGLGYSAAARVAGLLAAHAQHGHGAREARAETLRAATDLEGHADNAAAALYGGVVAVAGRNVVRIPLGRELAVVAWVPPAETATATARRLLPDQVSFDDAVFNIGRTALLVAALAGQPGLLLTATDDFLHQSYRRPAMPDSLDLVQRLRADGHAAVVSGAGPTVLVLLADDTDLASYTPAGWRHHPLGVAADGAAVASAG